jgi:hypothetical protein
MTLRGRRLALAGMVGTAVPQMAAISSGVWPLIDTPDAFRVSAIRRRAIWKRECHQHFTLHLGTAVRGQGLAGQAALRGCAGITRKLGQLDVRPHVGLIVQSTSLLPEVTVGPHLELSACILTCFTHQVPV